MATARAHIRIARPADEVWALVTDPTRINGWFPGVDGCTLEDDVRHVHVVGDIEVDEKIVTNDESLRRFQYSLVPSAVVPLESHLATVDVFDDADGSLIVYSIEVAPEPFGASMQQSADGAVAGLKAYAEGTSPA